MTPCQPGILASPVPPQACHLFFALESAEALPAALDRLSQLADGEACVVGCGAALLRALGRHIDGLRSFPVLDGATVDIPSTQHALWCWLRGADRGELLLRRRELVAALGGSVRGTAITLGAGNNLSVAGDVAASQGAAAFAGQDLMVSGRLDANGAVSVQAGRDLSLMQPASANAGAGM